MATLFVGTSGFAYPAWKPGFYPARLPAHQFLKHYAERLNCVEINYTFRRLPAAATLAVPAVYAAQENTIKIALVGCGGRGSGAVADAFDSMTTTRSYRGARSVEDAFDELRRCKGSQFDPVMVEALVEAVQVDGWELVDTSSPPEGASTSHAIDDDDPTVAGRLGIVIPMTVPRDASELDDDEALELLQSIGMEESGLTTLARVAFDTLGLQTYLTAGPKESRAWTVEKGVVRVDLVGPDAPADPAPLASDPYANPTLWRVPT